MPTLQQCRRALEVHEDVLSQLKNVVGLGVVKLDDMKKGASNNAVAVYVSEIPKKKKEKTAKKKPKGLEGKVISSRKKTKQDAIPIPKFIMIKGRGDAEIKVPVKIIEQGKVELESSSEQEQLGKEPLGKEPL